MGLVTSFSLRNPLVVAAVSVVLCVFGLFAYFSLGVAITPNVNFPSVVVTTVYPGADPETVETNVTTADRGRDRRPAEHRHQRPDLDLVAGRLDRHRPVHHAPPTRTWYRSTSSASSTASAASCPPTRRRPTVSKVDINAFGVATVVFSGQQPLDRAAGRRRERRPASSSTRVPGVGADQHPLRHHPRGPRPRGRGGAARARPVDQPGRRRAAVPAARGPGRDDHAGRRATSASTSTRWRPASTQLGNIVVLQTPTGAVLPARRREDRGHLQEAQRHRARRTARKGWRWSSSSCPTPTPSAWWTASSSDRRARAAACRPGPGSTS